MKKTNSHPTSSNLSLFSWALVWLTIFSLTISPLGAISAHDPRSAPSTDYESTIIDSQPVPHDDDIAPEVVFSNPAAINIPDDGTNGVTSTIAVAGTSGPISSLTLTLNNYTVPRPQHVDFLLVGPGGQKFVVMSDAGGQNIASSTSNVTITFSDAGASQFAQTGPLGSGIFRPVDYDLSVTFPTSPAPYQFPSPLGSATFGSVFGGLSGASVNGNWVLHVFDSASGPGTSTVAGGWSLDIVTTPAALPTTTALVSSLNPSLTNQAITLTSTTTSSSTVNTGVVNFVDNTTGTTLCAGVVVNASGVATCLVPASTLTERIHQITATYVGNATFATSNSSISQSVNNPTQISGTMYTNPGTIVIGDTGGTSTVPYPSNIFVSGLSGTISKVTISLLSTNLPETGDVDLLLVGPGGQKYVFWSDAGGGSSASTGTFILDDAAVNPLPASGSIAAGTYRPTDNAVESDTFPAPAPVGPYSTAPPNGISTLASVFGGAAPNGTWSLYATDDSGSGGITSSIAGWRLTFTTSGDAPTTTTLTGSPNPSTTAQAVLFTATVTSSSTVNAGTVSFRRGVTVLCANVPVNGSGVATCNAPAGSIPQGTHTITADYNGAPGQFNISSGTTTQQVNSPTVVSCLTFSNNGGITVSNTTTLGNPYPSNITVSALAGTISKLTLTMTIGSALTPDHNEFLLVGPAGQKFIFMGDAGGNVDVVNQTLTFDDAAASSLPDTTAITTGTYRPTSYSNADVDIFPAPAPSAPYNPAAPEGAGTFANVFNGANPNGTWSLYAVEDAGDAADTAITNWSITLTLAPLATTTTVTSSANPAILGQPVTFTATVSAGGLGIPTQNVQFFNGVNPLGGPVVLNGSGVASFMTSGLTLGPQAISAQYLGVSTACNGGFVTSTGALPGGQGILGTATWDGSASTDWHDPANWATNFVPTLGLLSIDIPATGVTNNPVITTSDVTVSGITIGGTRTLTIGAGRTVTANGAVSLGTGQVVGAGILNLGTAATITHGVGGQVNATLRKNFSGPGPSFEMPVGTTGQFSPLNVLVTSGSGQLTARANTGVPAAILVNSAFTLQRYWTLSGSGITSNLTFNYLDADVPGPPNDENTWNIIRVTGSVAVRYPPTLPYVHMSPGTNQFTIDGLTSYSDWTAGAPLAPTAANVNVSGRVVDQDGRGISGARVSMQNSEGLVVWAITNPFGYYRFTNVSSGQTYVVSAGHKRYTFEPRTINMSDEITGLDFIPIQSRPEESQKRPVSTDRSP